MRAVLILETGEPLAVLNVADDVRSRGSYMELFVQPAPPPFYQHLRIHHAVMAGAASETPLLVVSGGDAALHALRVAYGLETELDPRAFNRARELRAHIEKQLSA